jgi:AraC-like DNA-binding protein
MVRYAESSPRLATLRRARPEVEQVREHLHDCYTENVRLTELAQLAGLSPFQLCQAFRQEFGMPPHYYQTQHRIDRARKLLLEGRPVAEVALETGFYDQSHFTCRFKRFVGVTPARYRLHHRNMQDAQRGRG